jgi:enhancing lycopene biosynthesis protein 2
VGQRLKGQGAEKSVSSLASLVEERSVVRGSLKSATEAKAISLQGLAVPIGGSGAAKAISTKWNDAAAGAGLAGVNSSLVVAKNNSGDVPAAGTWAGSALVALAAVGVWRSQRTRN